MSQLSEFAAHARAMAAAEHKPDCAGQHGIKARRVWTEHGGIVEPAVPPWCHGCVSDADRVLWVRLAEEAEAFMNRHEEGVLL